MKNYIMIPIDQKLYLNKETQISKSGRPFRLSSIEKNLKVAPKWINKIEKYHWIYKFIYLDEQNGFIAFEFDYNDKFIKKL